MKSADLHLHTHYSDGIDTPEQLVIQAKKAGLSSIAVTDHDTIKGIQETCEAAGPSLEVIPGIELSAETGQEEIHILGYFIDYSREDFLKELDNLARVRNDRVYVILEKLKELGIVIEPKEVFALSEYGVVSRLHIARAMLAKGIISNTSEAFYRYIGNKCPAYVSRFSFNSEQAIDFILKAKGVPVLAHPYIYTNSEDLISDLVKKGLRGVEVYYPDQSNTLIKHYLRLAKKYNLLVTGGSDYHGSVKPDIGVGKVKIPYELVEKLKEAAGC